MACAYRAAERRFATILDELCDELSLLRAKAGTAAAKRRCGAAHG